MVDPVVLYDFDKNKSSKDWKVVDDTVMGGRSNGGFKIDKNGNGVFYGHVSLENNGGFSSVRYSTQKMDVQAFKAFEIRLRGDGKSYQFRSKASHNQRHSYIFEFATSGDWQVITIPFSEMYPAFRGNTLDIQNYPGEALAEIAFLIGNKKEQDFQLELDYISIR
ncbi:MAG: CIA30 family protein [Maribacter sp.]